MPQPCVRGHRRKPTALFRGMCKLMMGSQCSQSDQDMNLGESAETLHVGIRQHTLARKATSSADSPGKLKKICVGSPGNYASCMLRTKAAVRCSTCNNANNVGPIISRLLVRNIRRHGEGAT